MPSIVWDEISSQTLEDAIIGCLPPTNCVKGKIILGENNNVLRVIV
jgi:hypothetical protein